MTPSQKDAVNAKSEHVLVRGIPGSGKTFVLANKVRSLILENPNAKILFITYNNTLKNYIASTLEEFECNLDNLQISTYHSWARSALTTVGVKVNNSFGAIDKVYNEAFEEIEKSYGSSHYFFKQNGKYASPYKSFFKEEAAWLKGKGLVTREKYLAEKREGRGVGLKARERNIIYDYVELVNQKLKDNGLMDNDDIGNVVIEHMSKIKKEFVYDSIFIDEAQDLTQMQVKSLSELLQKGQLCIAADLGQKIYKTDYTWVSAGVNVRGGRIKTLDIAHRSTKEIMNLASSLLKHDPLIKQDDDLREYEVHSSGIKPVVLKVTDGYETDAISELVETLMEEDPDYKIGILTLSNDDVKKIAYYVGNKVSTNVTIIDKKGGDLRSPGAKVMTMHGAKGLEFDIVIIAGMNSRYPMLWNCPEGEEQERIATGRRLLYVSMTRAKEELYLVYRGKPTIYLSEMDNNLFEHK